MHHNNMYINTDRCVYICSQLPGHRDQFFNNTCVVYARNPDYALWKEGLGDPLPEMHGNRVYTLDGRVTENGRSLAYWQAHGHDPGTVVQHMPSEEELLRWARQLLGM